MHIQLAVYYKDFSTDSEWVRSHWAFEKMCVTRCGCMIASADVWKVDLCASECRVGEDFGTIALIPESDVWGLGPEETGRSGVLHVF